MYAAKNAGGHRCRAYDATTTGAMPAPGRTLHRRSHQAPGIPGSPARRDRPPGVARNRRASQPSRPEVRIASIPGSRHQPHRQDPAAVIRLVATLRARHRHQRQVSGVGGMRAPGASWCYDRHTGPPQPFRPRGGLRAVPSGARALPVYGWVAVLYAAKLRQPAPPAQAAAVVHRLRGRAGVGSEQGGAVDARLAHTREPGR